MALTLCFVADAGLALQECARVLGRAGLLAIGAIPADSPWGTVYACKASAGHPIYAHARFRTASDTVALVTGMGFELRRAASALFWAPGRPPETEPRIRSGIAPQAGFVALLFANTGRQPPCNTSLRGRR